MKVLNKVNEDSSMQEIIAKRALVESGWVQEAEIGIGADGRIASLGPAEGGAEHRIDSALPAPVNLHRTVSSAPWWG